MQTSRLGSLIRKEFIQIRRDPRTLVLVLFIPVMQLFLLGYAATNDVRNVPLAVFDQDRGRSVRELIDAYRAADYFDVAYEVDSLDELSLLIDQGKVKAGLIIPPDYSRNLLSNSPAQVAFVMDGSDPTVASTSLAAAQLIAQAHATQLLANRLARMGQSAVLQPMLDVRTQVWYNPDLRSSFYMIPSLIGMILYSITAILTASAVVRERERGTIEQLIVTPIRPIELMLGKILPYTILALLNTLEVLAIGHWWFDVPIRSNVFIILILSTLFLLTSLGIGLLISTLANTQQESTLMVFTTLLPSIFLSGFFFPLEAMPKFLQWVSYAIPLRYYLVIIRTLLIKGVSMSALSQEIIALAIFGTLLMTLAALRFRKRLD